MNADQRAEEIADKALVNLGEFGGEAVIVYRCADDIVVKGQGYMSRQLGLLVYACEHMKLKLLGDDPEEDI